MLGCASLAQAAPPVSPKVVPMGDSTYRITREANCIFARNTDKLEDLHQGGILIDAEFEAAKKPLMDHCKK